MAKLEDFLDIKFNNEVNISYGEDGVYDGYIPYIDSESYYLIKLKDNEDNYPDKYQCYCGYMVGTFCVDIYDDSIDEEYVDEDEDDLCKLEDEDYYLLIEGNLFYRDIYKKGIELYFQGEDSEYKVKLDHIEYVQKLE